jgi:hypothetical protein
MPPLKNAQKKAAAVKDTRSPEEIAIQSAANSNHHIMIPMVNAAYVRLRNPLTGKDHHLSTNEPSFFEMIYELSQKGLKEKLMSDFNYFADNYDPKWRNVIESLNGYFTTKDKDDSQS